MSVQQAPLVTSISVGDMAPLVTLDPLIGPAGRLDDGRTGREE
jgi:hypothetical protein